MGSYEGSPMTQETICPECSGAGFFGDTGPTGERCGHCNGNGVLVEDGPINVRAVSRIDELQAKHIVGSVFASMRRDEAISLFNQIQENRMHREGFGV
jgi:DnaJ-class molecular chaperone